VGFGWDLGSDARRVWERFYSPLPNTPLTCAYVRGLQTSPAIRRALGLADLRAHIQTIRAPAPEGGDLDRRSVVSGNARDRGRLRTRLPLWPVGGIPAGVAVCGRRASASACSHSLTSKAACALGACLGPGSRRSAGLGELAAAER
jgi:hypothetical protein